MLVVDMLLIRFDMLINLKKGSIQENTTTLINTEKRLEELVLVLVLVLVIVLVLGRILGRILGGLGVVLILGRIPGRVKSTVLVLGNIPGRRILGELGVVLLYLLC